MPQPKRPPQPRGERQNLRFRDVDRILAATPARDDHHALVGQGDVFDAIKVDGAVREVWLWLWRRLNQWWSR
jgi:hypothetical protein